MTHLSIQRFLVNESNALMGKVIICPILSE